MAKDMHDCLNISCKIIGECHRFYKGSVPPCSQATEALKPSHNSAMLKLPTLDECYQAIPFPSDERECAMFVAGIAECHKFVGRQLQQERKTLNTLKRIRIAPPMARALKSALI